MSYYSDPFLGKVSIKLPVSDRAMPLRTEVKIANLLSNALVVYRITSSTQSNNACAGTAI
jgi:hypothetical protein